MLFSKSLALIGVIVFLTLIPVFAQKIEQNKMGTKEILSRMEKVYSTCSSYRDSAKLVSSLVESNKKKSAWSSSFNTIFIRPNQFRFEYNEKMSDEKLSHIIVWSNGKKLPLVQSW